MSGCGNVALAAAHKELNSDCSNSSHKAATCKDKYIRQGCASAEPIARFVL
jgi:hypothetical protein